ncbi:hypothetical protein Dda_8650 [Drechslerella dactyloides]|uniref:Uncharacterized protein n=1 Tax=Drechslerella dactyloides TaxID=74499 RepID=A0AAD6IR07_DREDA|nr:hypothetical protein Dda_8650 [Drechslerella dactyloides]
MPPALIGQQPARLSTVQSRPSSHRSTAATPLPSRGHPIPAARNPVFVQECELWCGSSRTRVPGPCHPLDRSSAAGTSRSPPTKSTAVGSRAAIGCIFGHPIGDSAPGSMRGNLQLWRTPEQTTSTQSEFGACGTARDWTPSSLASSTARLNSSHEDYTLGTIHLRPSNSQPEWRRSKRRASGCKATSPAQTAVKMGASCTLDAIADVHYFISIPEERPLHSTFEKGTKVGLFLKEDTGRIRIRFIDAVNPKGFALSGDISVLRLGYGNEQECFVRAEIDYGEDQGVSFGSDWMVVAPDERNEGMHNWRPFCVDIYFWKHSMADYFVRIVDEYQKRLEAELEAKRKASIAERSAVLNGRAATPTTNGDVPARTPEPVETRRIEDEDEEEMFKNSGEIFPAAGSIMECRVIKNQMKKTTKILVSAPIDGGNIKLCYTLTDRSFPYQLPDSTVQVRFMLVEKSLTLHPGASAALSDLANATPLDSPIFQFELEEHAQIFLECLRGEQLLLNSIVDWVRCTCEATAVKDDTKTNTNMTNFTCEDDRRVQLWENELGFINIVFHRQFHLVSAFISPTTQIEPGAGATTLKVSGIKVRKLQKSPNMDSKEPWKSGGTPAALKLRFANPENVAAFRDSVLRHRDATAILFPDIARIASRSAEPTDPKYPPPPPPTGLRHTRSMSSSTTAVPLPPISPPTQFPVSPQSPGPHQPTFQQYTLNHSQSVHLNRPPPLGIFPPHTQPATYIPASIHSPLFQSTPPNPLSPTGLSSFPLNAFASPALSNGSVSAAPYQSPAKVAATSPLTNGTSYFPPTAAPATITPMTPGLPPSAKFPPPIQTSMGGTLPGSMLQMPQTPVREYARRGSVQHDPVGLPAPLPEPEVRSIEDRERERDMATRRFGRDDDIPEENGGGYNPLGGNVMIPMMGRVAGGEGGKMSRVWKKLK